MGHATREQIRGEAIRAAVSRLLASPEFAQSERMQRLLQYLIGAVLDGRGGELKETVIGVDVYGRAPGYDPKIDGIVRTEARRLRLKLGEYYGGAGASEPIRIDLPKGGYVPVFEQTAPPSSAKRRPAWLKIAAVAFITLVIFGVLIARNRDRQIVGVPRKFTTSSGNARSPVFSPDGSKLAFSVDSHGTSRIVVAALTGGAAVDWTDGHSLDYEPTWGPDGDRLAFLRRLPSGRYELRTVSSAGNSARLAEISGRDSPDWSPDGKSVAVSDQVASDAPKAIFFIDPQTGAKRQITTPPVGILGDARPRFSPDGSQLAFLRSVAEGADDVYILQLRPLAASPRRLTSEGRSIGAFAWMPSGDELLISVSRQQTARSLWRVRTSDGNMKRVADAGIGPLTPAASKKGGRIAWASIVQDTNIWRIALDDPSRESEVVSSGAADTSPRVSPDGRYLAFRSARTGFDEIWISDIDGDHARQLTFMKGPITGSPRWSPDGQYLLFDSRATGNASIYKVAAAGGRPVRMTPESSNDICPYWSRDGKFIYFSSDRAGRSQVFRMSFQGGAAEPLTREGGGAAFESPDGEYLYYARGPQQPGIWRIALKPANGREEPVIPALDNSLWGSWAVSSTGVYFVQRANGPPPTWQIAFLDSATGQTKVIHELNRQPVLWDNGIALSPDQKTLFFTTLDNASSDIYVLEWLRD
jgi:Tol biopolymer transport system component